MNVIHNSSEYAYVDERNYRRIIVIGDLHGYDDPLQALLKKIEIQIDDLIIFIGDYIDRGPSSKSLIDKLVQLKNENSNILFLKGNHEDMLLGSVGYHAVVQDVNTWLYNGGSMTLISYGMGKREILNLTSMWDNSERYHVLRGYIPESHMNFFLDLKLFVESDNYFFCHAGVNPGTTVQEGKWNTFVSWR